MTAPLLRLVPPADDVEFIRHVVIVGRRLPLPAARSFWRGRQRHVLRALEDAGLSPSEIAAHHKNFAAAVRAEAARQSAAAWEREGNAPVEHDARQRGASAEGEASEAGP